MPGRIAAFFVRHFIWSGVIAFATVVDYALPRPDYESEPDPIVTPLFLGFFGVTSVVGAVRRFNAPKARPQCIHCGARLNLIDGAPASVCAQCGRPQRVREQRCSRGHAVPSAARFCTVCGEEMKGHHDTEGADETDPPS